MKECTSWAHMCVSNPGDLGELCGKKTMPDERSCSRAPMNMLFHSNLNDAVLFEGLYACTTPSYLFTWLCIAVVGLLSEFLKSVKIRCLTKLAKMQSPSRGTEALQRHLYVADQCSQSRRVWVLHGVVCCSNHGA